MSLWDALVGAYGATMLIAGRILGRRVMAEAVRAERSGLDPSERGPR